VLDLWGLYDTGYVLDARKWSTGGGEANVKHLVNWNVIEGVVEVNYMFFVFGYTSVFR
jgi:hypothetical protein